MQEFFLRVLCVSNFWRAKVSANGLTPPGSPVSDLFQTLVGNVRNSEEESSTIMRLQPARLRTAMIVLASLTLIFGGIWCGISRWQPSVAELKKQSQDALKSRDWRRMEELTIRWTAIAPESGEAWLQRSESLIQQHKYAAALDCLTRIPLASPEAETSLRIQMELQFGPLNRPADGATTCEKLLSKDPQSPVARQRLIFFLTMTLQRTRLIQQIRQAIDVGTEPRESYVYLFFADSLSFANGAELNGQWLLGEPDSELFEVGEAIFASESLDASVSMDDREKAEATRRAIGNKAAVMETLLAKYPHNSELLAYNIRQQIQNGHLAAVVKLLAQSSVEAESDHRFWRFKGWVHAQRNQVADAENSYRQAIKLHPLDWTTRHMLAELLQQQQRIEEVKALRELVARANELRRELQHAPNARQIAPESVARLADYAADCGDTQMSDALRRRIRQYKRS